jgi:glycosyltransferase involved in cell wall biosynthesis
MMAENIDKSIWIIQDRIFTKSSGGYEIQIYNICKALISKGWNVFYIAENDHYHQQTFNDIKIHYIPRKYFFSYFNPPLFRILKQNPSSIVYQRSRTNLSCSLIGLRFAKMINAKFIFGLGHIDDTFPFYLTKSLFKDKRIRLYKKFIVLFDTIIKDILFPRNFKHADLIISQNAEQQNACMKIFNRRSSVIRSIHAAADHSINKDKSTTICWIANARPVKQPEVFCDLIPHLQDLSLTFQVRFIMVFGRNINKYTNSKLMETLMEYNNVEIHGELSIDEENTLMERSAILVNTSVFEGFSNTFIQAWLRETPIISLNSDPDDIIKNHKIGFHSGNFDNLVRDVRYLIENEPIRTEMGKRARDYAEKHHNIHSIAEQLDSLFTHLINDKINGHKN